MSQNAAIVRGIYEAAIAGDMDAAKRALDPEVKCYEAPSLPYGGEYHGHDGFTRLLAMVVTSFETFHADVKEVLDAGDTVIAMLNLRVTLKGSKRVVEMPVVEIWQLRDGKAIELRPFYWDTAQLTSNA